MLGYPVKLGRKNLFADSLILLDVLIGNHSRVKGIKKYGRTLGRLMNFGSSNIRSIVILANKTPHEQRIKMILVTDRFVLWRSKRSGS